MSNQQIIEFLKSEAPWFADMDCNLSAFGSSVDLAVDLNRFGGAYGLPGYGDASRLLANRDYVNAMRERLSIFLDAEDNIATRKQVFEKKKAADEAAELASLRSELKGVRVVNQQGERLDVLTLTLPQLRQHKADIENHKRMKGMSAGDLRAEYAAKHPTPARRLDGYPTMPQQMVVPAGVRVGDRVSDGIRATEMTPQVVYMLGRAPSNSAEFHYYRYRLCRAYGVGQVSERQRISIPSGVGEGQ
jgi:hypothetical protein